MSDARGHEAGARHGAAGSTLKTLGRRLLSWLGVVVYLLFQLVLLLASAFWNPWSPNLIPPGLVLLSGAVLIAVRYRPRFFKDPYVERLLLVTGGVMLCVEVAVAWLAPYTVSKTYLSLYHETYEYTLNPLLFVVQSLMVFLAALGHAARLGSLGKRWLLLDAPMLATFALQVWLGQRIPEFTG
jgi:uncharacterized membrane protein